MNCIKKELEFIIFTGDLSMNTEYRNLLYSRLQRGIDNKEFIIYLQPKVLY